MTHTPKTVFTALAEAIRLSDNEKLEDAVREVTEFFGPALSPDPEDLREFVIADSLMNRGRTYVANTMADLLAGTEGFDALRFVRHATDAFKYPKTPRRSWVDLAEAIRQMNDGEAEYPSITRGLLIIQRVHTAIDELPMPEADRKNVREVFQDAVRAEKDREGIATMIAAVLTGREKFDVERFVYHASSNSDADDDGPEGKWSYNRTHQAEAQKTTIEASSGETVQV